MTQDGQTKWVRKELLSGRKLTSMKAFEIGITRLSSIINRLRKDGWDINTNMIKPEHKGHAPYAEYKLGKI